MPSESGDLKTLGNFSKLIEFISINTDYNPANPILKLPALNAQKTAALAAVAEIGAKEAPYKAAVNERQATFEDLRLLVTRSGNMLKASGADQRTIDDAKTLARKISGQRKTPKPKPEPEAPGSDGDSSHSVSQRSYENIAGNFADYVALLATAVSYSPNEPDLKIAGLQALSADLNAKNESVNGAFPPVSAARGVRDELVYTDEGSVVNTALLVKAYVRAALGPDTELFKQIKGLQFKKPKK